METFINGWDLEQVLDELEALRRAHARAVMQHEREQAFVGHRVNMRVQYRGHEITYDPPPIGTRAHDWAWVHHEYDGPEDGRCGTEASLLACLRAIDEVLDEPPRLPMRGV